MPIPGRYGAIFLSSFMALGLIAKPGEASAEDKPTVRGVDCAKGQSVQRAIDKAPGSSPLVVIIDGTCTENVRIFRDRVELRGHADGGRIVGSNQDETLFIKGASNISIVSLTITGDNTGVNTHASDVAILNSSIDDNALRGIEAEDNSYVMVEDSSISDNGELGIELTQSVLDLSGFVAIRNNGSEGITAKQTSAVDVEGSPVTVEDNGDAGIRLAGNSNLSAGGLLVTGNAGPGLSVESGSSADIGESTISSTAGDGLLLTLQALAEISESEISGGVTLLRDSGIILRDNTVISGGLLCAGAESSFEVDGSGVVIDPPPACSGF